MNFPLGDTQKVPFTLTVTDADGNPTALGAGDSISVVSSDTESLTVVMDETAVEGSAASGFLVAGKKLAVGVTATATLAKADGTSISGVDTLDIIAGAASAIAFGLGAPVAQ